MNSLETEYFRFRESAGVMDLSARSRLCVTGADRVRFLNGQVTNNVKDLVAGQGCYAALVNAKGKLQSDMNIYCLRDELLLDFEPGLGAKVTERLDKYIIADDVRIVDVSGNYGMLTVQGPKSADVIKSFGLEPAPSAMSSTSIEHQDSGEIYCMNNPRGAASGFDIFVPREGFLEFHRQVIASAQKVGGGASRFEALEILRVEAGIPRFGVDMDENNLAPEAGIETRAISYSKGCYIGQEVISRIRAYGQVAKSLRGLRLPSEVPFLPQKGDKLFHDGKEVGYVTSAVHSPTFKTNLALGYVRREHNETGARLQVHAGNGQIGAIVCALPFTSEAMN